MKKVEAWESNDGRVFHTVEEAQEADIKCHATSLVAAMWPLMMPCLKAYQAGKTSMPLENIQPILEQYTIILSQKDYLKK